MKLNLKKHGFLSLSKLVNPYLEITKNKRLIACNQPPREKIFFAGILQIIHPGFS